jgi:hypothetical protein
MKIKPIVFALLFFAVSATAAQVTQTTLVFKDGRQVEGFGRLQGKKVKFVSKQQKKSVLYHMKELKEAQIKSYDTGEIEIFEYIKIEKKRKPKVLPRIVKGVGVGGTSFTSGGNIVDTGYIIRNYYLKLEGASEAIFIGSDDKEQFDKKFAKRIREFFKDCPEVITKIERGILRKEEVKEIVEFYNSTCH